MKRELIYLIILISFNSILFAKSRQQVIDDANIYQTLTWVVNDKNILDMRDQINNSTVPASQLPEGKDGYDDRIFEWDLTQNPPRWSSSTVHWPFVVNSTYTGEAYVTDVLCPTSNVLCQRQKDLKT